MRHLLNVWVRARETPGWCANLAEVRMQTFGHRIDQLDHVLPVTRQRLLHRAVFKQCFDDRILRGQWLQLPIACGIRHRDAKAVSA